MADPFPLAPALWAATACAAPATPPIEDSVSTDVVVIGAGYAGLSTALHLGQHGTRVVVLEAREPGWGGSGRNGGQVIPGLKYDPDELEAMFGPERGRGLVEFVGRSADVVFDLIDKHAMKVPQLRTTVIAPNSFQVATVPLSDNIANAILPEGHVTSDTRQLLFYFRRDHANRFIMGGRGPFREPKSAQDWAHLERIAIKLFPQLKDVPIEFRGCGRVTRTRDFLPHLHEPAPG